MSYDYLFIWMLLSIAIAAQVTDPIQALPPTAQTSTPVVSERPTQSTAVPSETTPLPTIDVGCPAAISVDTEVATCVTNANCVDGLLCCPTTIGNVHVCRKSRTDLHPPVCTCHMKINSDGLACEHVNPRIAWSCLGGACKTPGDQGVDINVPDSNAGASTNVLLQQTKADVDLLKRRFDDLEKRINRIPTSPRANS